MIRASFLAASVVVLGLAAAAADAASLFGSRLSGKQEVPPNALPNLGAATYMLKGAATLTPSLSFDLLFDDLFNFGLAGSMGSQVVTGLHIHQAQRGVNGPVVFGIINPDSDDNNDVNFAVNADGTTRITGVWNADEGNGGFSFADFAAIFASVVPGDELPFYLNLHTIEFPAGAIRGQITAVPLPAGVTLLLTALGLGAFLGRRVPRRGATT